LQKQFQQTIPIFAMFWINSESIPLPKTDLSSRNAILGMEHQSAIAYGNGFKNGYLGSDLSELELECCLTTYSSTKVVTDGLVIA
jgi:hypothetical protein